MLSRNLRLAGFETPTPVQAHSVPMALAGADVISVAQTGSGKTLAFMLPILRKILQAGSAEGTAGYCGGRDEPVAIRALVLAPTRELAQQVTCNVCNVCNASWRSRWAATPCSGRRSRTYRCPRPCCTPRQQSIRRRRLPPLTPPHGLPPRNGSPPPPPLLPRRALPSRVTRSRRSLPSARGCASASPTAAPRSACRRAIEGLWGAPSLRP